MLPASCKGKVPLLSPYSPLVFPPHSPTHDLTLSPPSDHITLLSERLKHAKLEVTESIATQDYATKNFLIDLI